MRKFFLILDPAPFDPCPVGRHEPGSKILLMGPCIAGMWNPYELAARLNTRSFDHGSYRTGSERVENLATRVEMVAIASIKTARGGRL